MCLATYEMNNFEFLLGMNIWYDILFAVNFVSKIMQSKDMHIDVAIDYLRGLIIYLKNYRKNGSASTLESTKEMTKCKIHRKKHFVDIDSDEIAHSAEDSFNLKTLGKDELKKYCINIEKILSFENYSDIDGLDLFQIHTLIAYRILLTLPVTIVTAEISFSKLKLIKSYLSYTTR
uniref:Uncharacterized protein n=1 Tax=Cajanus cajan TaxID=3821 RepID=A0A151S6T6_CAJCA|nr:hypothetical protein KK1_027679 [Cajanus cajan]